MVMCMGKRQVCILLDEEEYKKLAKLRDETGLPLSKIIELKLKGYEIVKSKNRGVIPYQRLIDYASKKKTRKSRNGGVGEELGIGVNAWEEVLKLFRRLREDSSLSILVSLIARVVEFSERPEAKDVLDGVTAVKEYLTEALALKEMRREDEAEEALEKASNLAGMVYELLLIKSEGGEIVDLEEVGEVAGRPIYTLKRNSASR